MSTADFVVLPPKRDSFLRITGISFRAHTFGVRIPVRIPVVLLGSAPLLVQQGLTENLAGRLEILRLPHWSSAEMRAAFGFSACPSISGSAAIRGRRP